MARLHSDSDRGQIVVLAVLMLSMLLGVTALAIDGSFMYDTRNRLYAAADAAAKSAAIEVQRNPSVSNATLTNFAHQQVSAHGFDPDGTTGVVINRPPASGPFAGQTGYVEAIVSESTNTFFARVLGVISMTPAARSVAGTSPSSLCALALGTGSSLQVGNATLTMASCALMGNGNFNGTNPNATVVGTLGVTGTSNCTHCGTQFTGVPPSSDPLIDLPVPTNPGGCTARSGSPLALTGGSCHASIAVPNNGTLTFGAGLHYITGPVTFGNNATVSGSGVTLYLAPGASFSMPNNGSLTLSAPTSGTYEAIAFYQDRANTTAITFGNSASVSLQGVFYAAGSNVTFANGLSSSGDCTLFVANALTINNGNGTFRRTCSAFGGSPFLTVTTAE